MSGFGRCILVFCSENLLPKRSYSLNLRHISKNAIHSVKEDLPAKPKRPVSVFLLYIKHVKSKFQEEDPHIKYADIIKKASKEWVELDSDVKKQFQVQYNKNLELYMQQLRDYYNSVTDEQKVFLEQQCKKRTQNKKDAHIKRKYMTFGKPKKPPGSFFLFSLSKKNERSPDMNMKSWSLLLSNLWNKISDTEKEVFVKQAAQLKEEYFEDLYMWEKEMIRLGHFDIVRAKTLKIYKRTEEKEQE